MKKEIFNRLQSPTPKFFKKIRTIGLTIGAIGTALLSAPISLPAVMISISGYMVAVGLVASAISSAAVDDGHTSPN